MKSDLNWEIKNVSTHHESVEDTSEGASLDGAGSLKNREWLNTDQAAEYLALSVGALRNMTSNGQVPYRKLGNRNRYLISELRTLLLANKRGGMLCR